MAEVSNSKLLQIDTGIHENACVVIVRTEWNAAILDELEKGCFTVFEREGVKNVKQLLEDIQWLSANEK